MIPIKNVMQSALPQTPTYPVVNAIHPVLQVLATLLEASVTLHAPLQVRMTMEITIVMRTVLQAFPKD